jgi:hypothetical protein
VKNKSWQDWLDIKIPSIDKEHRNLFDLMGQLSEEINLVVPEKPCFPEKIVKKIGVFIQQSVENGF